MPFDSAIVSTPESIEPTTPTYAQMPVEITNLPGNGLLFLIRHSKTECD